MWANKSTILLVTAIFLMAAICSSASAREITVDNNGSGADFKSIQEAVNNSSSGDTVIVMPGTYEENVIVNVTSLTIMSESKNSEALVKSHNENKSVFLIIANNVTLSGFNITGAKGLYTYYPSGICLKNARNCRIKGNTLFENNLGVCLVDAGYNTISGNFLFNDSISLVEESSVNNLTDNTIEKGSISLAAWSSRNLISKNKISNGGGISVACCGGGDIVSGNTISNCSVGISTYDHGLDIINNRIMDCGYGIDIDQSSGTRIYNNTILNCSVGINVMGSSIEILNNRIISSEECGISIPDRESDERIYNNYFNNTMNVRLGSHREYIWNNSRTSGTNIVGGPYLGGNFWAKPDGTGFSQTCMDSDGDWICDSPYNVNGSDFDFLPLASISRTQEPPAANFSTNITGGLAPLVVQFADYSRYALVWNWDFDNDGISDSTEKDPVYEYKAPGNYTVNLTVSNANGAASITQEIIAQEVKAPPLAYFSANTTSGQAPLSVLFTDLTQNAAKRTWDLNNDGTTDSTNKTAVYTYTFPGTYIVNLTVINSKGSASELLPITVSPVQRVDGQLILTEYQITASESYKTQPVIYGGRIVWCDDRNGNRDIYMYDLSTSKETQITTSESYEFSPDIYDDRIVWTDLRNGNEDIYMYNLSTKKETPIITNGSASNPKIYEDRLIWEDHRNGDGKNLSNHDIYMYNLSTHNKTQITSSISDVLGPDIYGDKIVWQDDRDGKWNIYMYNLSIHEETQITTNESGQNLPVIYGDRVAWTDSRNRYPDIYMYDISTSKENQITTNESLSTEPAIYGDRIVWQDGHSGNGSDIYMYDSSTSKEIQITTSGSSWSPDIYSNRIVWIDSRNGNSDIYMCIISEQGEKSPVANFSAYPTSGRAPLKVLFTDRSAGSPTSWLWDFGDDIHSKHAMNATHTFTRPGKYNVSLTVTNAGGTDTENRSEYIVVSGDQKAY